MKKLLFGWRHGSIGLVGKLDSKRIESISKYLKELHLPIEINLSMRDLKYLSHWKAREAHNFLNYIGIVVMKDNIISADVYKHFLILFTAVTICSVEAFSIFLPVTQNLFESFIEEYAKIYGSQNITSNVHNLEHIVNDVKRFGPLYFISTYPFENQLGRIKKMLRNSKNTLASVANRLEEMNKIMRNEQSMGYDMPSIRHMLNGVVCLKIDEGFTLTTKNTDCWFLTQRILFG